MSEIDSCDKCGTTWVENGTFIYCPNKSCIRHQSILNLPLPPECQSCKDKDAEIAQLKVELQKVYGLVTYHSEYGRNLEILIKPAIDSEVLEEMMILAAKNAQKIRELKEA